MRSLLTIARRNLKTSDLNNKKLGTYPVTPDVYHKWHNRYHAWGGQYEQTISPYQQKIMWQIVWGFPQRMFWRVHKQSWNMGVPFLFFALFLKSFEHDNEEMIRKTEWY